MPSATPSPRNRPEGQGARQEKIDAMRTLGEKVDALDADLKVVRSVLQDHLDGIPNIPDPGVPVGVDDSDNIVLRTIGKLPVI